MIRVQQGNTSQPVADKLVAEHQAARVRVYAYDEIERTLDDLSSGGCGAFMKLAPVTAWLVRDRPSLKVVEAGTPSSASASACAKQRGIAQRDQQSASGAEGRRHAGGANQTMARCRGDAAAVSVMRFLLVAAVGTSRPPQGDRAEGDRARQ